MDIYREEVAAVIKQWVGAGRHIPTQDQIDIAVEMVGSYKGNACEYEALKEFLLPLGICIREVFKDVTLVYWAGDPKVKSIAAASLEELPELLTSEDYEVRLLAKWKLDDLNK